MKEKEQSFEPSAQCENMIKTRPAMNIQVCKRDDHDHIYGQADSMSKKLHNTAGDFFVTGDYSNSDYVE